MQDEALTTGVDDLINLLKTKGKIPLHDAAKDLHMSESTLQLWVDFLVEERVLGIEYKFTKAYVFINNQENANKLLHKDEAVDLNYFKQKFFELAKKNNIPEEQIIANWRNQLRQIVDSLEKTFTKEVQSRKLPHAKVLLEAYKKRLSMM